MMRTTLMLGLLVVLAGCIELPEDPSDPSPREPATGGTMTGTETSTESNELCGGGLDLAGDDRFCATRVVTISGKISGFDLLDVALETFNGDVSIATGRGDAWELVATLQGRGATADAAQRKLDAIEFRWAHEDADGHFLEATAESDGNDPGSVDLVLRMPASIPLRLTAVTSNGDVTLEGNPTDGLALTTSNGEIVAEAAVTQVALTTSNGEIVGTLTPRGSGSWVVTTSNGEIELKVPEGPSYGYQIQGQTSNGEVEYDLRDGTKGPCPQGSESYTPPCTSRSFETNDLRGRDARVSAVLTSSNGDVTVGRA